MSTTIINASIDAELVQLMAAEPDIDWDAVINDAIVRRLISVRRTSAMDSIRQHTDRLCGMVRRRSNDAT